jgi:hypothetical protein
METTLTHVPMLSIQVVANSHIQTKVLVCGGEHNSEEIIGLTESELEIEETAVDRD